MNEDLNLLTIKSPTLIGNRYTIEKELGRGGIGVVFKAKDTTTDKYVVIKVLHDVLAKDEWVVSKFRKEAQAIVEKLKGVEGVVKGIEEGILPNGAAYLVMEYIEGKDLRDLTKRSSTGMGLERSANILKQLGETLTKIHNNGIYHRDLKPDNIMLTLEKGEEKIKVIDFGIATVKESPDEQTKSTIMAGTPVYMAPEQLMGKPTDKSDIYAMGVIAYEMVTGRIPFNIAGFPPIVAPVKLYEMQEEGLIVKPKQLRPDLSTEADRLIVSALSFSAQDRFTTAQEFGQRLYKALMETENFLTLPTEKVTPQPKALTPTHDGTTIVVAKSPNAGNHTYLIAIVVVISIAVIGIVAKVATTPNPNPKPLSSIDDTPSTTITPTPTITNKLSFTLDLQEFREGKYQTPTQLTGEKIIFHDKDRMRFNIVGQKAGYLYLLNEAAKPQADGTPNYFPLFPTDKEANYFAANQEVNIPKKDDIGLEFAGSKGTEEIWIVWSDKQLPELEAIKPAAKGKTIGAIENSEQAKAIQQLLTKYRISKLEENKTAKKMEASTSENSMAVLVELEHR